MTGVPRALQPQFVKAAHSVEGIPGGELSRKLEENCAGDFDDDRSLSAGRRAEADDHKSYRRDSGRTVPSVAHAMDK